MQKTFTNLIPKAAIACACVAALCSCTSGAQENQQPKLIGLANPASVNCIKLGGESVPVDTPQGQIRMCRFPDGSQCEEWALLRGECKPGK
jgi:uncharacterized protein